MDYGNITIIIKLFTTFSYNLGLSFLNQMNELIIQETLGTQEKEIALKLREEAKAKLLSKAASLR